MVDYEFNIPTGSYVLPVCISGEDNELVDLIAALELYRRLRKSGQDYPAFDAVLRAMSYADNPQDSPCLDIPQSSGTCWSVDATSQAIRFFPNDPFDPVPENRPIIGQWERWQIALQRLPEWADSILDLAENQTAFDRNIGYFPNDCFVVPPDESANDVMQFFNSLNAIRKAEFPYIEIELQGAGELELHLLQVPFGGSAIIVYDMEFDVYAYLWDLVNGGSLPSGNIIQTELEREIATFPPESNEENVIEIDFTDDTDHIVRVYFVPRIDYTALDFLGNGGGIREISACGGLALKTESGELITRTTHRLDEFTKGNVIMATTDEIYAGMICAMEKVAQRILLANESDNIRNSVEIDKNTGQTIIKTSSGLSRDDFTATNQEAHFGGVHNQAKNIRKFLSDIKSQSAGGFANDVISSLQSVFLNVEDAIGVTNFVTDYVASSEDITIDVEALALTMFCKDINSAFVEYAAENHTGAEITILLDALNLIPTDTLNVWYETGYSVPRNGFESASCYFIDTQEFEWDVDNFINSGVIKPYLSIPQAGSRIKRIEFTGKFTGDNGREFDGFYYKHDDGSISYEPPVFAMSGGGTAVFTKPQYQPSGGYSVTLITPVQDDKYINNLYLRDGLQPAQNSFVNPTGQIDIKLIDVGQA